jgi:hypothetical protein
MTIDVVNTALALNRRPAVTGEAGASAARSRPALTPLTFLPT